MKTRLHCLFITLLCGTCFAQDYVPYLDNSTWNVRTFSQLGGTQDYFFGPGVDEVVGDYTYKKYIDILNDNEEVLLREDVAEKKVYRRIGTGEIVLFDFSLEVDDYFSTFGTNYQVVSITNVPTADGGQTRIFALSDGFFGETWIEGAGNYIHPFRQQSEMYMDPAKELFCSYHDGENIYNSGLANNGNANDCESLFGVADFDFNKVQAAPNPFSSSVTISSHSGLQNTTVTLYNTLGEKVLEMRNPTGQKITLQRGNLAAGIYFLSLEKMGHHLSSQKLVITD